MIDEAQDQVIFVDETLLPLLEKIAPKLSSVKSYVLMGGDRSQKTTLSPVFYYEDLLEAGFDCFDWPELHEEMAAGLCYTSGTTGHPKGVLYSHRSQYLHAMAVCLVDTLGLSARDTVMPVVPMFHANAWGLPYAAVLVGAQLAFPGPFLKAIDLASFLQEVSVTVAAGVPTLWLGLFQELKTGQYKTDHLQRLVVGGAAMPRSLIESFEKELGISIIHAWGMTELSPLGTTTAGLRFDSSDSQIYDQKAKQGLPAPGLEVRILGDLPRDLNEELPWDGKTPGKLQVRGPWVVSSYFQASHPALLTQDGWFDTGDISTIDPQGCIHLVDRSKDLIKSGGEWISSMALENALMAHPEVMEAVVVAMPDQKWGERPLAWVVLKNKSVSTLPVKTLKDKLQIELSKTFAKFWIPEKIDFVQEIPKTSIGKFDKKKIREQVLKEQTGLN